jgi:arylsulfatase A-like enzyme
MSHIYQREAQFNEEWMVVLTTDHGGNGTGHGGQDNLNETRYVWYVVRSPSFTNSLINNGESVDLLPTMMKWLEVSTNGMSLDGTAIY